MNRDLLFGSNGTTKNEQKMKNKEKIESIKDVLAQFKRETDQKETENSIRKNVVIRLNDLWGKYKAETFL